MCSSRKVGRLVTFGRSFHVRMKKNLLAILILHASAVTFDSMKCMAYHANPLPILAISKLSIFKTQNIGKGVLGKARPHQQSMTIEMAKNGYTTDDDSDKITQILSSAEGGTRRLSDQYNDWLFNDRKQRVAFYGILAFLETVYWYYLAPGIDPQSRWFNPLDGKLILSLLDPSIVFSPPVGSGLGFSSLLLNSFLVVPMAWSLLLLQEGGSGNHNDSSSHLSLFKNIIQTIVCAASFFVGGGILIPYMIFRRPMSFRRSIDPKKFPAPLRLFEKRRQPSGTNPKVFVPFVGQVLFAGLVSLVVTSFFIPFANHHSDWIVEWNAFSERARSSQFTSLALYDLTMISMTVVDPMMDDAIRRGYVVGWETSDIGDFDVDRWRSGSRVDAIRKLAPYVVIPLIGPTAWICFRPRYDCTED